MSVHDWWQNAATRKVRQTQGLPESSQQALFSNSVARAPSRRSSVNSKGAESEGVDTIVRRGAN